MNGRIKETLRNGCQGCKEGLFVSVFLIGIHWFWSAVLRDIPYVSMISRVMLIGFFVAVALWRKEEMSQENIPKIVATKKKKK